MNRNTDCSWKARRIGGPCRRFIFLAALLLAAGLSSNPAVHAGDDVLLVGDSWAALTGLTGLWNEIFAINGHPEITVYTSAFHGGLARDYADEPHIVPDLLAVNPDYKWIMISLGGNDMMTDWTSGDEAGWEDRLARAYRKIINPIINERPDVPILLTGYDLPNFAMEPPVCPALALMTFPPLYGIPALINTEFLTISAVQGQMDDEFSNVKHVALWGTLQEAGGVPDPPNIFEWTPEPFMTDCIHANETGYTLFTQAVYDAFFVQQFACATDADGDGFLDEGCGGVDCDDGDPAINPGAEEIPFNGIDDDCNATTPDEPGGCATTGRFTTPTASLLAIYATFAILPLGLLRRRVIFHLFTTS